MTTITVIIDGKAVAKGRGRATKSGIVYTPANTRKWEAHARLAAQDVMAGRPPLAGPVWLTVIVELPIPKSWPKWRQKAALAGEIYPTSRPDIDNYAKSALDTLNTIVVCDDSQVVELTASKRYSATPRLTLTAIPLGTPDRDAAA